MLRWSLPRQKRDNSDGQGLKQKLDYTDLAHTPDDGRRYELLDGALIVSASPCPLHQRVSKRLQRQLEACFEEKGLG